MVGMVGKVGSELRPWSDRTSHPYGFYAHLIQVFIHSTFVLLYFFLKSEFQTILYNKNSASATVFGSLSIQLDRRRGFIKTTRGRGVSGG